MSYKPEFNCQYCGEALPTAFMNTTSGYLGVCDCEESRKAWEQEHRAEIERRKRSRRRSHR